MSFFPSPLLVLSPTSIPINEIIIHAIEFVVHKTNKDLADNIKFVSFTNEIYFNLSPTIYYGNHLEWKHLLKDDSFKEIIISSLQFLYKEGSIIVYAFVIMPNHIHMIWQIQDGYVHDKIQDAF